MNRRGAPCWDPEDVLDKRPAGLLGPAPSDTMIQRHNIQDPESFRADLANLNKGYTIIGMSVGVALAGLAVVVTSYADPIPLVAISIMYLVAGLYYNHLFEKGATA